MKKIILLIVLSAFFMLFTAKAAQINQETALRVAQNYVKQGIQLKTSVFPELELAYTATAGEALKSSGTEPVVYYYIFNIHGDNGFIIISGDDAATPVLGYSLQGKYGTNDPPPAFTYWMECLEKEIECTIENQWQPGEKTRAIWEGYISGNPFTQQTASVAPLVTPLWDQAAPFYNLCPEINGQKTVTGCVATAMAIVMKYHNHPAQGTGSSNAYTTGTGIQVPAVSFEINYQWANMQDTYAGINPVDPGNAVATLMYHCGVSVSMNYDLGSNGGSGAMTRNVARVLPIHFGYDKGIQTKDRRYYDNESWDAILRDEIDNKRPVLYSGRNSSSGHAFVCDGYDDSGKFHFNWGWSGMFNGYYVTNALEPGTGGIGGGAGSYSQDQAVIINIKPDAGGSASSSEIKVWPGRPLTSTLLSVDRGEIFGVTVPVINPGISDFTGYLGIARVDENDAIQEIIGQRADPLTVEGGSGNPYGYPVSCKFTTATSPGNHTIRAVTKIQDGEWMVLKGELEATTDKLEMELKDGIIYHGLKLITVTPLAASSETVGRGEYFNVTFAIRNSDPGTFTGNLGVGIVNEENEMIRLVAIRDRTISGQGYYLQGSLTCALPEETDPGSYKLRIVANPDGQEIWSVVRGLTSAVTDSLQITVTQQVVPDASNLMLFNANSNPGLHVSSSPIRKREPITVETGVLNQGNSFNGELELGIYSTDDELIQLIDKKYISANNGVGISATFSNPLLTVSGTHKLRLYAKPAVGEKKLVSNFMTFKNDEDITIEPAVSYGLQLISDIPFSGSPATAIAGESFNMKFTVENTTTLSFTGKAGIGIFKEDDLSKEVAVIGSADILLPGQTKGDSIGIACMIPVATTSGNYKLMVMAREGTDASWSVVDGPDGVIDELAIQVVPEESDLILFNTTSKPGLDIVSSVVRRGDSIAVEAGIKNRGTGSFDGELELGVYSSDGTLVQLIEKKNLVLAKEATADLSFSTNQLTIDGTYKLRLYSQETGGEKKLVGNFESFVNNIDIIIQPEPPHRLQLISGTLLSGAPDKLTTEEDFTIKFALENTSSNEFRGDVGIGIFKENELDKEIAVAGHASLTLAGKTSETSYEIACMIPEDTDTGAYKLRVIAKADTAAVWSVVEGQEGIIDILAVEIIPGESELVLFNAASNPGLHIIFEEENEVLRKGDSIIVEAGIMNRGTGKFEGELELGIYSSEGLLVQLLDKNDLLLDKGKMMTCTFFNQELTVDGPYKLRLYYTETGREKTLVGNYESFENDIDITIEPPVTSMPDMQSGTFNIYPNPVKDILTIINLDRLIHGVRIYSYTGNLIERISVNQDDKEIKVSVSHLIPGMYILSFETQEDEYKVKIIKE